MISVRHAIEGAYLAAHEQSSSGEPDDAETLLSMARAVARECDLTPVDAMMRVVGTWELRPLINRLVIGEEHDT